MSTKGVEALEPLCLDGRDGDGGKQQRLAVTPMGDAPNGVLKWP